MSGSVTILGVFNADLVFKAKRLPMLGETLFGDAFELSPGGKGLNQAVAVRRSGATPSMPRRTEIDAVLSGRRRSAL